MKCRISYLLLPGLTCCFSQNAHEGGKSGAAVRGHGETAAVCKRGASPHGHRRGWHLDGALPSFQDREKQTPAVSAALSVGLVAAAHVD